MEKVPALFVDTLEGEQVNLIDLYQGKDLLVLFYNNQCLGCTGRAIPLAYDYQARYPDLTVVAVHVNFSKSPVTRQDIHSIFTMPELPFPIYLDQRQESYRLYQSEGTPHWFLINKEGALVQSIFGSQAGAQNRLLYAFEELNLTSP